MTGIAGGAHKLEARIRDQRRASVRDERDRLAVSKARKQFRPRFGSVVLVICGQRSCDAKATRELARHARIFTGDDVGTGKSFERSQCDVAQSIHHFMALTFLAIPVTTG